MPIRFRTLSTALGWAGYVSGPRGLLRIYVGHACRRRLERLIRNDFSHAAAAGELLPDLADALARYFSGQAVSFDIRLDDSAGTPFERGVWRACRRIPYGRQRTSRQLAHSARHPRAYRAVGSAMSRNPWPIVVPCHRVVRSDGGLGGYSAPGGLKLKRRLLDMEAAVSLV